MTYFYIVKLCAATSRQCAELCAASSRQRTEKMNTFRFVTVQSYI